MYFLLEYDRRIGKLRSMTRYGDSQSQQAYDRLAQLELEQLPEIRRMLQTGQRPRMEYVVLGPGSETAMRKSHANYFKTTTELEQDIACMLTRSPKRNWPAQETGALSQRREQAIAQ